MLKQDFVPVAFDQWYQRQQKDAEGEFYRKIASRGPRGNFRGTTQGFYLATANGEYLGYNNNRGPERIRAMMRTALRNHSPEKATPLKQGKPDPKLDRSLPQGAYVIRVNAKILGGYDSSGDRWQKIFRNSISRDNLWVLADEKKALARGVFPDSLAWRIARFHLVDNTRGEPPMWQRDEITKLEFSRVKNGQWQGRFQLQTENGQRGFDGHLIANIAFDDEGELKQFDLVARGEFWGEGRYTRGAPQGKFPLAVTFRLADGKDPADNVAPQGTKGWMQPYLEPQSR